MADTTPPRHIVYSVDNWPRRARMRETVDALVDRARLEALIFRLLFIEDDPAEADLLLGQLGSDGWRNFVVVRVATPRDYSERARTGDFDAVLVDLASLERAGVDAFVAAGDLQNGLPLIGLYDGRVAPRDSALDRLDVADWLAKRDVTSNVLTRSVALALER